MVHNIGVLPLLLRLNKVSAFKDNPKLLIHVVDIIIPKLYPNAGQLILSNWNFSFTISQTVLTHNKIDFDSPDEINLNDIIFLAYNLNKIETMTDEECIPDKLASSSMFLKLWLTKSDAYHELTESYTVTFLK